MRQQNVNLDMEQTFLEEIEKCKYGGLERTDELYTKRVSM